MEGGVFGLRNGHLNPEVSRCGELNVLGFV